MLTFNNHMYCHFQKTGGTFVQKVLNMHVRTETITCEGYSRPHCPPSVFGEKELSKYAAIYYCVRHPITWHESAWKFLRDWIRGGQRFGDERNEPLQRLEPIWSANFNKFIEQVPEGFYINELKNYLGDYVLKNGVPLHTETLSKDVVKMMHEADINFNPFDVYKLPKFGSRQGDIKWDDKLRIKILKDNEEYFDLW